MNGGLERRIDRKRSRAREAIETEIRRTRAEQAALREFATAVRGLQVETASTGPVGATLTAAGSNSLRTVQRAYESTVMAVPHYEAEYDDTYAESVREEFGPDVATALVRGRKLDRMQKRVLLGAIEDSIRSREELLEVLDAEQDSHAALADRLQSIAATVTTLATATASASSFGDYDAIRNRLGELQSQCADLIDERQATLIEQRERLSLPIEGPDVPSFVYTRLDCTYPILDATATILARVESLRETVEHEMAHAN